MSAAAAAATPAPAPTAPAPTAFTPLQTSKWELGVALILNFWTPLTDAVSCSWGGGNSSEKRDWLCGTIADMWANDPETDDFDVETTLVQVMEDEFEVNLEDDSAFDIARQVLAFRKQIIEENYSTVDALHQRFLSLPRNAVAPKITEVDQDAGSSDEEDDDEEMGDAPAPAPTPRERVGPVFDDDGFQVVQKGRRR